MPTVHAYGETVLEVGDKSRDGLLEITGKHWDHNGTMWVTVVSYAPGAPVERMRRLARRALAHPHATRSSRVVSQRRAPDGTHFVTFAVSRLP